MSLKANCCPRCLTLKADEPGHVHTCSPTPVVRELEQEVQACFEIAQRLDAENPNMPGAFTGTPSERIKRHLVSMS